MCVYIVYGVIAGVFCIFSVDGAVAGTSFIDSVYDVIVGVLCIYSVHGAVAGVHVYMECMCACRVSCIYSTHGAFAASSCVHILSMCVYSVHVWRASNLKSRLYSHFLESIS